jgi:hypothetical protein
MKSPLKRKPLRNPGQALDEEIQRLFEDKVFSYFWFAGGFFILALMEWYGYLTSSPRRPWLFTCGAFVMLAWATWKIIPLKRHIAGLKQGRDGERAVGQFLERLRSTGAQILHDIPGDDFNLDHVVISERGIFVVETKTWSKPAPDAEVRLRNGEILVDGYKPERDPVRQVQAQISWLARTLEESTGNRFPVRGALVFPGWFVDPELKNAFEGLWVLEPKALPSFIDKEPIRLSRADVFLVTSRLSQLVQQKDMGRS